MERGSRDHMLHLWLARLITKACTGWRPREPWTASATRRRRGTTTAATARRKWAWHRARETQAVVRRGCHGCCEFGALKGDRLTSHVSLSAHAARRCNECSGLVGHDIGQLSPSTLPSQGSHGGLVRRPLGGSAPSWAAGHSKRHALHSSPLSKACLHGGTFVANAAVASRASDR